MILFESISEHEYSKALHLLRSHGYEVEDVWLTTRDETDAFKAKHDVATTPQTFIDGERIGGHDDLRRHLGLQCACCRAAQPSDAGHPGLYHGWIFLL